MAFTFTPYEKKEYQQSDRVSQAQNALQQHEQNKPGQYQSQWQQTMDDLLKQYQNRGNFQYDVNADAMYQQMVDRYLAQGKQGMMDTIGQAAALTGGYGNSYAQTAGQQTYQNFIQSANDMMPQYYQMALDKWNSDGSQLLQQYQMAADRDNTDYNRYIDNVNQYYSDLDRLRSDYDSERNFDYNRWQNDQSFAYGQHMDEQNYQYKMDRDATEDAQWEKQWGYQQERDQIEDKRYDQKVAQAQVDYLLSIGADVPDSLIEASGYDAGYVAAAKAARQAASSGGGGGSSTPPSVTQAALFAKKAQADGYTKSDISAILKSAGLAADKIKSALNLTSKITLAGNGGQFASRKPR